MTQTATVERLLGDGRVLISVARQSACAHNCAECAGCGGHAGSLEVRAVDRIGVSVGEKVLVQSDNRPILTTAALVYLVPAAAFLVGYGLGASLSPALHALVTVAVTALGAVPALVRDRRSRKAGGVVSFEIVGRM